MSDEPKELLTFPTDYPIKIVGTAVGRFRARIHAVILKHVPNVETDRISERPSENSNFLSISYTIVAESREQVVALAERPHRNRRRADGHLTNAGSGTPAICYLLITAWPSRRAFAPGSIAGPMSITLDQVTKRYQGLPVVNDVSVEISDGEFFVLLGPSGSGKNTLLRAIAGLTG